MIPPFLSSGPLARLVAIILFLACAIAALVGPTRATPTSQPPLYAVVTLGETTTQTLTLFNTTAAPVTATLYEANTPYSLPRPALHPTGGLSREATPTIPEGESADLLVFLNSAADLGDDGGAAGGLSSTLTWAAQGQRVYDALTRHAAVTQAPLLHSLEVRGHRVQSFWIINALRVRGDNELVDWLVNQPEVARVTLDTPLPAPGVSVERDPTAPDVAAGFPVWGLNMINAPTVWAQWGVSGAGITIATLDSGADYNHPALAENYRGRNGYTISHDYNWFDAIGHNSVPFDPVGHGTHVMGTLAARRGTDIPLVGVAPAARWIAARGCGRYFCQEGDILEAAQWLLAPTDSTGANPRPDLRPHIINNSWGFQGGADWYVDFVAAWRAAGIFAPFAAGNGGDGCNSLNVPAAGAAFAVGATTHTGQLAAFSARGPSYDGRIKPELVAPGRLVYSAYRNGEFGYLSGTSMSTPHVAGTVALVWSANLALIGDVATTERILLESTRPIVDEQCGPTPATTPNNGAGAGLLDAEAAVRQARVAVPWLELPTQVVIPAYGVGRVPVTFDATRVADLGTYQARLAVEQGGTLSTYPVKMVVVGASGMVASGGWLVSNRTQQPIVGTVQVAGGPRLTTDAQGLFTVQLLPGSHTLTASALGHLPLTVTTTITEATILPLTLTLDAPQAALALLPPLTATLDFAEVNLITATITNPGTQPPDAERARGGAGVAGGSLALCAPL